MPRRRAAVTCAAARGRSRHRERSEATRRSRRRRSGREDASLERGSTGRGGRGGAMIVRRGWRLASDVAASRSHPGTTDSRAGYRDRFAV